MRIPGKTDSKAPLSRFNGRGNGFTPAQVDPLGKGLARHTIFIRVQSMGVFLRSSGRFIELLRFLLGLEVRAVPVRTSGVVGTGNKLFYHCEQSHDPLLSSAGSSPCTTFPC